MLDGFIGRGSDDGGFGEAGEEGHDGHDGVVFLRERDAAGVEDAVARVAVYFRFEVLVFDFELEELDDAFFACAAADVVGDLVPVLVVDFEAFKQEEEFVFRPGGVFVWHGRVVGVFHFYEVDGVCVFGVFLGEEAGGAHVEVYELFFAAAGGFEGFGVVVA